MQNLFSPLIKIYKALYLFAYDITGNYGLALILLSLFTFIVLYPFNKKAQQIQIKEHKIQSVLAPQIDAIKKQYSGREQYEQLQWLYQRYGYHPLYAIRSALGFIIQIPFLTAAYYMLSGLTEIQGVAWGFISNLGAPDHLLDGINLLPFVMTLVTVVYAFVMPEISKKERLTTVVIGVFFLLLLYSAPSALLIFWTCNLVWSLLCSLSRIKLEWTGNIVSANELAIHIFFTLSITVGLLIPTDIYIKNASQLWFNYKDILSFFLEDTIKYFALLLTVYIICNYKNVRGLYLSLLLGVLFGIFLQSYIIGLNYGTFDGHKIEWGAYKVDGVINTLIWLTCFGISYVGYNNYKEKFQKFIKPFLFLLVSIQCLVLIFTVLKKPIQKDIIVVDGKTGILTTQDMYTISTKDNIIVFLIDAFDASLFEEIIEKNPEILKELKDFTYYPDTISSYGYTHFSLPEILTGKQYDNRKQFLDYLTKAWRDNHYYRQLKDKNFFVNLYTDGTYVAANSPIDNFIFTQISMDEKTAIGFKQLVKFRIVPHVFKYIFYRNQSDFLNPKILNKSLKQYRSDDRNFFVKLRNGLVLSNRGNAFKFYHLNGLHHPFILDENVNYIKDIKEGSAYKQAIASLKIVIEFILQMKQHGVYNNSSFAILADHGNHNTIGSRPILLIKQKRSNSFSINYRPTEVLELMPLILQEYGDTKVKVEHINSDKKRFYYYEDEKRNFIRYLVKSPAKDKRMWMPLGKVEKNIDKRYNIGETIDFSYLGNSFKYKESGWYTREFESGSAIAEREANLVLSIDNIDKVKSDLKLDCIFGGILQDQTYQNVRLFVNDYFIGTLSFENGVSNMTYKIPRHIINQKILRLRFLVDRPEQQPIFDAGKTIWLNLAKIQLREDK